MEALAILIEEIRVDNGVGSINSTLYQFDHPEWISVHLGRPGQQIGPITILHPGQEREILPGTSVKEFGEKPLRTGGAADGSPIISHQDTWTVPSYTLYALILPELFVANRFDILVHDQDTHVIEQQIGVHNGHLFYHVFFDYPPKERNSFEVLARIERNENRYWELCRNAEVVEGKNWKELTRRVGEQLKTPDFWGALIVGAFKKAIK